MMKTLGPDGLKRFLALQADAVSAVTERFYATYGAVLGRFGPRGREATREALTFHLEFLRPVLEFGLLRPMVDYLAWLDSELTARAVPKEHLALSLEWLAEFFISNMDAAEATVVSTALQAARSAFLNADGTASPLLPPEAWPESVPFEAALLAGDQREALAILSGCIDSGRTLIQSELHVIQPALYRIGEKWQANRVSVAQEHLATAIVQSVMTVALLRSTPAAPVNKRVLLACVEGNDHAVGLRMVADTFQLDGWEVQYLGASVPTAALLKQVATWKPDLVGLSVSFAQQIPVAKAVIAELEQRFGAERPAVMIGGLAINRFNALADVVGADSPSADVQSAALGSRTEYRPVTHRDPLMLTWPELEALETVVTAWLDESGTLLNANAGFLRLIRMDRHQSSGANVSPYFIQPDFAALLRAQPGAEGDIHRGLLTLGDYNGHAQTLRGCIWREGIQLRLLAEYDVADLERVTASLLDLNSDYAAAQAQLARTNLEIRRLNAELERRVEERTRALSDALLHADAADRAKSAFLANMGHELHTPLNAILGLGHIVGAKLVEPGLRAHVETIARAGTQLLEMVNMVLEISALDAHKGQLETLDFALAALLTETLGALRHRADGKGLVLAHEIDPALPPSLCGDALRLGRILAILTGNAVKFSDQGRITLRALLIDSNGYDLRVRFAVEDHGIGIATEQQAAIFSLFEQVDTSATRKHGGLGLGLALCKRLAQHLGGEIGVNSALGQGSTFWIAVPLRRVIVSGHTETGPETEPAKNLPTVPHAVANPAQTLTPNPATVRAVIEQLDGLLAQSDTAAMAVFDQHAAALRTALGAQGKQLRREIGRFEFASAREILRNLRNHGNLG